MKKKNIIFRALALVLTLVVCATALCSCGTKIGEVTLIETDNFKVNGAMLSYSAYGTYYYYVNYYGEEAMLSYFGIDTTKPLANQYTDEAKTESWLDVFVSTEVESFKTALALCEAGYRDGIALNDIDNKYIDYELSTLFDGETDEKAIESIISESFEKGVTVEDIRKTIEYHRLANKKYYAIYAGIDATDAEIEEYISENRADYDMRDVKYITLKRSDDAEIDAKIKEYADKLKAASSIEGFESAAAEYIASEYCLLDGNKVASSVYEYSESTDTDKWVFAADTAVGSTFLLTEDNQYTVYIAASDIYRDKSETRSMYHILFSADVYESEENCKAKADEVLALYLAGDKSLDSFKALAAEYTTDYVSVPSGGEYKNLASGDIVDGISSWLFDAAREEGDVEIVESEAGYHIIYYAGEGMELWKATAYEAVRTEKLQTAITELAKEYEVKVYEDMPDVIKGK